MTTLSQNELEVIALNTVQKINSYPQRLGKTVDNYFDVLYPDELKNFLIRRAINEGYFAELEREDW